MTFWYKQKYGEFVGKNLPCKEFQIWELRGLEAPKEGQCEAELGREDLTCIIPLCSEPPCHLASHGSLKKGGKKKDCSAISKVVTKKYTISIHKHIHGMGFWKSAPCVLKKIWKFSMKEMGIPDAHIDSKISKVVWAK